MTSDIDICHIMQDNPLNDHFEGSFGAVIQKGATVAGPKGSELCLITRQSNETTDRIEENMICTMANQLP